MNGFWTIQQVLAFVITATAVSTIVWRIIRKLIKESNSTHKKVDAIETLLIQIEEKGMTVGAEKALSRLERRMLLTQAQVRLVMEIDGTGYCETNKDGGLVYCNTQFIQWTGLSLEDAKGYGWIAAIHPEDRARVSDEWTTAVKEQRSIDLWFRYKYNSMPVYARAIIVRDDRNDEQVLGFMALIVPTHRVESRERNE